MAVFDEVEQSDIGAVLIDAYREVHGQILTVGAGGHASVACYQTSLDPPYFSSVGDLPGLVVESFSYGGSDSEYLPAQLIAKGLARQALCSFIDTGERPECVHWVEV